MKKLNRSDPGIEYIRLFAEHSKRRGFARYQAEEIREFSDTIADSLRSSVEAEHRKRGIRAELVFEAVVAGLGSVKLLKEEDNGNVYYQGDDLKVPDFRIVLGDGRQLFVEVKTQGSKRIKISDGYIERLRRYATMFNTEIMFAIFWEQLSIWTLNKLDAFRKGARGERQWQLEVSRAMATNEMALLGDRMIGTRAPLKFRVYVDPERSDPAPSSDGQMMICVAGVKLLSQDRELEGLDASIAWKLIWYGDWEEVQQNVEMNAGQIRWIDHVIAPPAEAADHLPGRNETSMIGILSRMLSRAYLQNAKDSIHASSDLEVLQPGYMKSFIPPEFWNEARAIPIIIGIVQPNYNFGVSQEPDR